MTKNAVAEKQDEFIYYRNMHNTMVDSDKYLENWEKKDCKM